MRIAVASACDTAALAIWNIGTRTPAQALADVTNGMRHAATLRKGSVLFVAGAIALASGAAIVLPAAILARDGAVLETLCVVTALLVEQSIGEPLRARGRAANVRGR